MVVASQNIIQGAVKYNVIMGDIRIYIRNTIQGAVKCEYGRCDIRNLSFIGVVCSGSQKGSLVQNLEQIGRFKPTLADSSDLS